MKLIKKVITGISLLIFVGCSYAATTITSTTTSKVVTTTTSTTTTTTTISSSALTGPKNTYGTFIFNPRTLIWYAYASDGTLVKTGYGSGGSNYCKDLHRRCHTPVGTFSVYGKGNASCKSSKFPIGHPGAPMPWCMYFHNGFAVHGSYEVRNYNASHGCIRIYPEDAYWLSHNLITIGTVVIVKPY